MTRAFVTGIGGQDGSYLAERLLAEGVEVHALAHEQEPPPEAPGVELHTGDLTRVDDVRALLLDLAPDEVYNLAAISSVARSWDQPDLTALVNGTGRGRPDGVGAARCRTKRGRQVRFVQASSAEIFGQPEVTPQDETTPIRPVNPYGAAKAYAHLSADVYRRRDLHAVSAILYNHESPRRPATFVTRKITSTVAAIAQGRADRLSLGNLDARRDWGWAPDYVDALVRAARADVARDFVIATGVEPQRPRLRGRGVPPRRHRRLGGPRRHRPGARAPGRPHRAHRRRLPGPAGARLGADGRLRGARRPDGRRGPRDASGSRAGPGGRRRTRC